MHKFGLTGKSIKEIDFQERRNFIRKNFHIASLESIRTSLEILQENKKDPRQLLKILWFLHLIAQEAEDWRNGNLHDILVEEVNNVFAEAKNYLTKKRVKKATSG